MVPLPVAHAMGRTSGVRLNELLDRGRDILAPFAAVEDAVVTDVLGEEILLFCLGQLGRNVERSLGLADAGDVVALALDRQQRRVADRVRPDQAAAMLHLALRQLVLL